MTYLRRYIDLPPEVHLPTSGGTLTYLRRYTAYLNSLYSKDNFLFPIPPMSQYPRYPVPGVRGRATFGGTTLLGWPHLRRRSEIDSLRKAPAICSSGRHSTCSPLSHHAPANDEIRRLRHGVASVPSLLFGLPPEVRLTPKKHSDGLLGATLGCLAGGTKGVLGLESRCSETWTRSCRR